MKQVNKISKKYALIHLSNGKTLKKNYDSCMKAFYEHEQIGCLSVELFNQNGILISSYINQNINNEVS